MANISEVADENTARTDPEVAAQRARNLAILGARNVLELCVGPSLKTAEDAYRKYGISVTGNDIDPRWVDYHPGGKWLIGDALEVDWSGFDCVVFAPPLSRGCTGRREDALKISEVYPSYEACLSRQFKGIVVMVLPARALATAQDRSELYRLLNRIGNADAIPMTAGARNIRKYLDIYFSRRYA